MWGVSATWSQAHFRYPGRMYSIDQGVLGSMVICHKRLSLSTIWSKVSGQNRRKGQGGARGGYRLRYYSHLIGVASEWFCCGLLIMRSRSLCATLTTPWTNLALNCGLNTATIRCSCMRRYSSKCSAGRLAAEDDLW